MGADMSVVVVAAVLSLSLLLIFAPITWFMYRRQGRFPYEMYILTGTAFLTMFLYLFLNIGFMSFVGTMFFFAAFLSLYRICTERRPAGPGWRGAAIGRFRSGPSSISVVVSRYVFGSRPFQVSVDGERAAEAYAGEVIRVFVSEGAHEVAVYRHRLSKADCEIDLYEGEGLFICRDAERRYQVFPITGPGDRAKFEEGSRRSYMKGRRNLKLDCVGFAIVGAVAWAAVLFI